MSNQLVLCGFGTFLSKHTIHSPRTRAAGSIGALSIVDCTLWGCIFWKNWAPNTRLKALFEHLPAPTKPSSVLLLVSPQPLPEAAAVGPETSEAREEKRPRIGVGGGG